MSSLDKTMHFDFNQNKGKNVYDTLQDVYNALEEKGYNPINQIVGYLLSGDPAYHLNLLASYHQLEPCLDDHRRHRQRLGQRF